MGIILNRKKQSPRIIMGQLKKREMILKPTVIKHTNTLQFINKFTAGDLKIKLTFSTSKEFKGIKHKCPKLCETTHRLYLWFDIISLINKIPRQHSVFHTSYLAASIKNLKNKPPIHFSLHRFLSPYNLYMSVSNSHWRIGLLINSYTFLKQAYQSVHNHGGLSLKQTVKYDFHYFSTFNFLIISKSTLYVKREIQLLSYGYLE